MFSQENEQNQRGISVTQLNNYIRQVFEAEAMLQNIEVYGEVDGLKVNGTTAFFTIKDEGAVINCVCYAASRLEGIKNGSKIVARGGVKYWHKAGKIAFTVVSAELMGYGALYLQFLKLKEKLTKEGIFDKQIKKQIPSDVKKIGVVTSRTGAVLHDIVKVARRRNPFVNILLYSVKVQGAGADTEIAAGIDYMAQSDVDCIIVARGGGSSEDLSAFNSECVVRSAFKCGLPLISAVGHQTDFTLIDFASDLRAPTPSAAAEMIIKEYKDRREQLQEKSKQVLTAFNLFYSKMLSRLTTAKTFFVNNCNLKLATAHSNLKNSFAKMHMATNTSLAKQENTLSLITNKIELVNPISILKSGYAKVFATEQIKSVNDAEIGQDIDIELIDGKIKAKIKEKKLR